MSAQAHPGALARHQEEEMAVLRPLHHGWHCEEVLFRGFLVFYLQEVVFSSLGCGGGGGRLL